MELQGNHCELPNSEQLKLATMGYLREGGEIVEADMVGRCVLEVGAVKYMVDHKYAIDITLRCCRELVIKLRPAEDGGEEPLARRRIRVAIRDALPGGFCIATFEARAGLNGGTPVVSKPPPADNSLVPPTGMIQLGRMSYLPGFTLVWVAGKKFDLRQRKKIRLLLKYLVENKAFDSASARHFENEINPYVLREGDYPNPSASKIDHYFNDRAGELRELRKELIRAEGGTGRYYLQKD